jgi:hypothetical protein
LNKSSAKAGGKRKFLEDDSDDEFSEEDIDKPLGAEVEVKNRQGKSPDSDTDSDDLEAPKETAEVDLDM